MATKSCSQTFYFLCSIVLIIAGNIETATTDDEDRKVYIVYMGSLPEGEYSPTTHHLDILKDVTGHSNASNFLVRSYTRSFNGFSARITNEEAEKLSGFKEVVSVFPNGNLKLQTTRSWDFMGLSESVKRVVSIESDTIIGLIDTGIWPESESFNDEGLGPPPKKWKGACVGGRNFTCNNKVIGARYYSKDDEIGSRDIIGHGSVTSSIAAGRTVVGTNFYGLAKGNARGGVPSARIATYNVCGHDCSYDAVFAAFDDAIADGVDIISVSMGLVRPDLFSRDPIPVGGFHAMKKGILTIQAAGNSGSKPGTILSRAPWLFTVAASTTDRLIIDNFTLVDGTTILGSSINAFELNSTMFPLGYGKDIQKHSEQCNEEKAKSCLLDCLDGRLVKGKIVVCNNVSQLDYIRNAHPVGAIAVNDSVDYLVPTLVSLPATVIDTRSGNKLISYINSTKMSQVSIRKSEEIKDIMAPVVAFFSSRGPIPLIADLLKPDITAPGVSILAAYSPLGKVADETDTRSVNYSITTGTSMACPHVTGSAAYVKSFHPDWSPSAIKSALMTTAWPMNAMKNADREFAYGAGHINPVQAVNPGLVYETFEEDYIKFLCSIGYTPDQIRAISGDKNVSCNNHTRSGGKEMNYPTMTAQIEKNKSFNISFPRTATNVGNANSTYKVKVLTEANVAVNVVPEVLSFDSIGEKKSFVVNVAGGEFPANSRLWGSLIWSDGIHNVRSPITLYTPVD